ncbi:hypothetical protein HMY34_01855 [Thiothrix subterranea]|uniref:hypothetical protein n=1 Tax=Thiothrix subterranea TaxID=2735563 RepID=UPI00192BBB4B|nr:hypothetical protein [Thiothrix subterranea]QQZ27594.1 hypothetical protein HMY34_01855 [Thiothrix subterranea]
MKTCKHRLWIALGLCLSLTGCNAPSTSENECPPVPPVADNAAVDPLPAQLQQQQLALEALQAKLNDAEQRLQQNQQQLAEKTQQLDALTQDSNAKQVATTTNTLTDLEEQLAQQQQEIERLNTALRQADDAKAASTPNTMPSY